MNTGSNEEKPALSEERLQGWETCQWDYYGWPVRELVVEIRRLREEVGHLTVKASSYNKIIVLERASHESRRKEFEHDLSVRDGVIADLKAQLVAEQDAHHRLQRRYNALFDTAGDVTDAHTWNEPLPGVKIDALSSLLNRQANEEDDQC